MDMMRRLVWRSLPVAIVLICLTLFTFGLGILLHTADAGSSAPTRRVNMPYLGTDLSAVAFFEPAVFWFGAVTPTINHADVRIWYYDTYMELTVHIIDRRLWHDPSPSPATLDEWDAVSIYLNRDGNTGQAPTSNSYRLVTQLLWGVTPEYQTSFQGNGSTWVATPLAFTGDTVYRGGGQNNDADNSGWQLTPVIPFASLGLAGPPPTGTIWGLAFAVHDRDDASGTAIPDQIWPEQMAPDEPASWGQLHFGQAQYNPPTTLATGSTTIRHGLDGAIVPDGHVGGHTICGDGLDHWTEWGEANYAGYNQINIQNQWDISDYPCFSKYFVTFPLDSLPPGKTIIEANLSMTLFGGAGGGSWGEPPDSYIQVLTIGEDWNEATLTWNNAPLANENISGAWVKPAWLSTRDHYYWNVSKAVAEAYQSGQPLRLALYSADGERHSGKYFWSSDFEHGDYRPTLRIFWGDPCDPPDVVCTFSYLPSLLR